MIEALGFASAVVIGISLGLIGGGGSILTVPVLVYLLGISPVMATAYSLFIVGASSFVGSFRFARKGLVDFKTAFQFGVPGIIAVYSTRKFIIPAIPESLFELGGFTFSRDLFLMTLFALLMVAASYGMIKKTKPTKAKKKNLSNNTKAMLVVVEGLVVGV
ncbi:MAG: TSUP family transporter, partial [Salibacteraceae bacterium]